MAEIKKFLGLRTTESPERLKLGEFTAGLDVDITNLGRVLSRRGRVQVNANPIDSLYANHRAMIGVSGTNLVAVEANGSYTTLKTLSATNKMSCETVIDTIYWSNGTDTGRIVNRTPGNWGLAVPIGQPIAAAVPGNLPPGRYMYALTFVRSDGHESGTGLAGTIDISDTSGISFSSIAVSDDPEVLAKNLYLSTMNGEVLYYAATIENTQTTYTYTEDSLDLTIPLITQFAGPAPAGTLVRTYNGMMYVVKGDTVFYSDPYNFELFRLDTNFLRFPGRIVMFEAVNDGIYVGTPDAGGDDAESVGAVWFLPGDRPDQLKSQVLFDYGVVENTCVKSDAAYFESEAQGEMAGEQARPIVVWTTRHGICVGRDSGNVQNLTEAKYSFVTAQRGAAMVRLDRGFVAYVVSLQGPGIETNLYSLPA